MVLESVDAGGGDPQRAVDLNRLGFFRQNIPAYPSPAPPRSRSVS
jgi:hypothetical protein